MRNRGITLHELMIVVVVIAVLALIALPSFQEQLRKSRRAEAKQGLSALQLRQERWRANHANYLGTDSSAADISSFGTIPAGAYYTYAITSVASGANYTLTATRKSDTAQAADKCGTFTLRNVGGDILKETSSGIANCW
jgi:type IV pilus assembly protein PilE